MKKFPSQTVRRHLFISKSRSFAWYTHRRSFMNVHRKTTSLLLLIFRKHTKTLQHYAEMHVSEFRKNREINVRSMDRSQFMSLDNLWLSPNPFFTKLAGSTKSFWPFLYRIFPNWLKHIDYILSYIII